MKLRQRIQDAEYLFPAFKFLSEIHAAALYTRGNVHLPTLYEFRDQSRYDGQILDLDEGKVNVTSFYSCFNGRAKDAEGTLPVSVNPYALISARSESFTINLESGDLNIYCMTRFMLSESLVWAIGEKKTACVLITDVERFIDLVSNSVQMDELLLAGLDECLYTGRHIIERDPSIYSLANWLLGDVTRTAFCKPKEYRHQKELRAIWRSNAAVSSKAVNRDIPSVVDLCIPVKFKSIDPAIILQPGPEAYIGGIITRKSDDQPVRFKMKQPWEICSPVIFKFGPDGWRLGFYYMGQENVFDNVIIEYSPVGITSCDIGVIFCAVPLDDVKCIEFFHS